MTRRNGNISFKDKAFDLYDLIDSYFPNLHFEPQIAHHERRRVKSTLSTLIKGISANMFRAGGSKSNKDYRFDFLSCQEGGSSERP